MAIFRRKTGGTKVGNALRKIAGRTTLGRAVNTVAPRRSSGGSSSSQSMAFPLTSSGRQIIQDSNSGGTTRGVQSLIPKPNYSNQFTPIPRYDNQFTPIPKSSKSSSTRGGGSSSQGGSGSSSGSSSYGPYLPSGNASRSSSGGSPVVAKSVSSGGSMFGGLPSGAGKVSAGTGSLNVPVGGSVLGSTEFDYNKTPQQIAEEESLKRQQDYADRQSKQDVNEDSIYKNTLRKFQGEIDATNQIVAEKLRQAREAGQSRLGSTRAENFNSGAVDSSFGNAATQRVIGDNQAIEGGIMAEQLQAIAQIENQARTLGEQYFQDRRAAKESGLENYLNVIKNTGTLKDQISTDIAMSIFNNGVTVDEITPSQLSKIAKDAGITTQQIKNSYAKVLQEMEKDVKEADAFTLSQGETRFGPDGSLVAYGGDKEVVGGTGANDPVALQAKQNTLAQADNGLNALQQIAINPAINQGGFARKQSARVSGTPAYNLKKAITTLQALLSFSALQEMRNASKTGGALGQVSERELDLLGSTVANLDIGLSPEILIQNLQTIESTFNKLREGASIDLQGGFSADSSPSDADFDF